MPYHHSLGPGATQGPSPLTSDSGDRCVRTSATASGRLQGLDLILEDVRKQIEQANASQRSHPKDAQTTGTELPSFLIQVKNGLRAQYPSPDEKSYGSKQRSVARDDAAASSNTVQQPELMNEIIDDYANRAVLIRKRTYDELLAARDDVVERLSASTSLHETNMKKLQGWVNHLATPLSQLRVSESRARPDVRADQQEAFIGDVVRESHRQLRSEKKEIDMLWAEWKAAQEEVDKLVADMPRAKRQRDGMAQGDVMDLDHDEFAVAQAAFSNEMELLAKEVERVGRATLMKLKQCEKNHRQRVMPQLQLYMDSLAGAAGL